jgi:hypothetical protein
MLGAVAFHTGGILVDYGWVKILGSGCSDVEGDLLIWNGLGNSQPTLALKNTLVIGYDVVGGFFAINGGGISQSSRNNVFYRAPDTMQWEDCEKGYTDFLYWLLYGNLEVFYENARWPNWKQVIQELEPNQGFLFEPPLWIEAASEGRQVQVARMREIWQSQNNLSA